MGVFNPTLETQIAYEQPVQAPRQYNALTDIAKIATGFAKAVPTQTAASADRAILANFGNEINRAMDLKEQGKNYLGSLEKAAISTVSILGKNVPEDLKVLYQNVSGRSFDSLGGDDNYMEDSARIDMLTSEKGQSLYLAVKASDTSLTNEQIETAVVDRLVEDNFLQASVDRQKLKLELGQPIEPTPILQSIQNDFNTLNLKVKEYQADNIITRDEFLSASTSVKSLIASKYAGMEANPQVKAVITQMNGLLDDIGKGVSTDPLDVQLDAIQVALTKGGFDATTIAVTRSMIKTNPTAFKDTLLEQFQTAENKTWVDALVKMWDAPTGSKIDDIFTAGRPEVKDNPKPLKIPSVETTDPKELSAVIGNMSKIISSSNPSNIRNNEETRNQWFNATNTLATIVASTGGDTFLGEELLERFASKSMLDNLKAAGDLDKPNAEQTSQLLMTALGHQAEMARNKIRKTLAAGDGQFLFMQGDKLVLDTRPLEENVRNGLVSLGERRLKDVQRVVKGIEEAGGLEQFFRMSETRREEILEGSNFERIFNAQFNDTFKLYTTLQSIRKKEDALDTYGFTSEVLERLNRTSTDQVPVSPSQEIGATPKPAEYTRENPYVFKEGISAKDAKAVFDSLPIDSVYIDPSDGLRYTKDK